MNIPNVLTVCRILATPVVVWLLLAGNTAAAFLLFLLAGLSDALDGWLAKRFNWRTTLGAYLDPLADKLLLVSLFLTLGVLQALPSWLVIGVVSRDVLIVAAVLLSWVMGHPVRIAPLAVSKANTAAQIGLVAIVLAERSLAGDGARALSPGWVAALGPSLSMLAQFFVWLTALLTLASLALYLRAWLLHMKGYDTGEKA